MQKKSPSSGGDRSWRRGKVWGASAPSYDLEIFYLATDYLGLYKICAVLHPFGRDFQGKYPRQQTRRTSTKGKNISRHGA